MPDFKTILAAADDQDKIDLTIAYNAKVVTAKAFQDRPGKATSDDRKAVDADYIDLLARMVEKYFPEETPAEKDVFTSISEAYAWLQEEKYDITERSVRNHIQLGSLPAKKSRNGKVKEIRLIDLKRYAKTHLSRGSGDIAQSDFQARLIKAQAEKAEFENGIRRGEYIELAKEEQRDAKVLAELRRHIETSAPDRLQEFIAQVGKLVNAEVLANIVSRQPEWLAADMDFLDQMFDRFGGA